MSQGYCDKGREVHEACALSNGPDGRHCVDLEKIRRSLLHALSGLQADISLDLIEQEFLRTIYADITERELEKALVMAAISFVEQDPAYDTVATNLLLQSLYREIIGSAGHETDRFIALYRKAFIDGIIKGVNKGILDERMLSFDLEFLSGQLVLERDFLFKYLGLQTLHDRYFIKVNSIRMELPQAFYMRVAMGLALNEENKEARALEFYTIFSTLRYCSSTPTLFHAGYKIAQLSSCYLTTVKDDLGHIFKCIGDNAQLAKWAGGIGNDWTSIRGTGALIKSIRATSQGVIPFLKLANDVVVAITRSGIRRGGTCAYLEVWHSDFEDFIDLRKNTGDERRRTHDMNTASWIPDLFMKRVSQDGEWTFFSPSDVPDLHELYGAAFEKRYHEYEQMAREGLLKEHRVVSATKLWRKMLSRLFETGHPWITFKDPCNIRSPQDHVGVVHSSNLCTEITLNTSVDETAVCNLGSINIGAHIINGVLDQQLLQETIRCALRMLDNVIELNFYPTKEAYNANMRHRPVGLGIMGFQDALIKLNIPFSHPDALKFADESGEIISYYALLASSELARERGAYQSFPGSKWDRGILPLDTLDLLEQERGMPVEVSRTARLDWTPVRTHIKQWGMRNSNVLAVAPTATIANIVGCYPSIEPLYKNVYVKANIAGEFTVVNAYLVNDLKARGLWSLAMMQKLKYYDGELALISEIPQDIKEKYQGAFELDPIWLLKISAARGKWIDQSQSHNVFMKGVSGKKLEDIYTAAWRFGLKTTYYLRTLGASQIEKSTLDAKTYGFTQKRVYQEATSDVLPPKLEGAGLSVQSKNQEAVQEFNAAVSSMKAFCDISNTDCESCQ